MRYGVPASIPKNMLNGIDELIGPDETVTLTRDDLNRSQRRSLGDIVKFYPSREVSLTRSHSGSSFVQVWVTFDSGERVDGKIVYRREFYVIGPRGRVGRGE